MTWSYAEAYAYIKSLGSNRTRSVQYDTLHYSLERPIALLKLLGRPDYRMHIIHVAGTKGKGSTSVYMANALQAAGYRVGLHTTPHLHTFRERFVINGVLISEAEFASLMERLKPVADLVGAEVGFGPPTEHEMCVAAVLWWFAERGADWAVIEVGVGGRLDSTNVVNPEAAVVTPVSLDHMNLLGPTITSISTQKAGIIKPGRLAISAWQQPDAAAVLRARAAEVGAPLFMLGEEARFEVDVENALRVQTPWGALSRLQVPLIGDHQYENAAVAVTTLAALRGTGRLALSDEEIRLGIARTKWPARFEIIQDNPLTILDGAHNDDSLGKLDQTLRQHARGKKIVVFATPSDKAIDSMMRILARLADYTIFTDRPGALLPVATEQCMAEMRALGVPHERALDPIEGFRRATAMAGNGDSVVVTGSLALCADVRAYIKHVPQDL